MNRSETFDGFQLDDNSVLNQQINSISTLEFHILVDDRDRFLAFHGQLAQCQFFREAFFVGGLQQAGPKKTVNLNCCPDDLVGNLVVHHAGRNLTQSSRR